MVATSRLRFQQALDSSWSGFDHHSLGQCNILVDSQVSTVDSTCYATGAMLCTDGVGSVAAAGDVVKAAALPKSLSADSTPDVVVKRWMDITGRPIKVRHARYVGLVKHL